jgi:DNA-directed RNA polymerase specialized sigma24 family protein
VHESTKGASVEDHVRHLRRYKGELVRDLAYGTVRLPVAWLAPGDATILALDSLARLDADQSVRFKVLLDQCAHLVDLIESQINTFIGQQRATGFRFTKNDLESLRRGRGPGRVRDLLFLRCPIWPESVTAELAQEMAAVLCRCLQDRQSHQAAAGRDLRDFKALIQPLMPEVRRLVFEWTALKRLRPDEADYVVSEVLDQLIRTVAERNGPPGNLAAWSHSTARWKWLAARTGPIDVALVREFGTSGTDDIHDEVTRRVDLERRLQTIADLLHERATWYATLTPPRPDDALAYRAAAHLVGTRQVELLEVIVRGLPEGMTAVRAALARQAGRPSAGRAPVVIRIIRDMLRRHLDAET